MTAERSGVREAIPACVAECHESKASQTLGFKMIRHAKLTSFAMCSMQLEVKVFSAAAFEEHRCGLPNEIWPRPSRKAKELDDRAQPVETCQREMTTDLYADIARLLINLVSMKS